MHALAQLAGFFASHGIWCVSEGEDLIPMVAFERATGERVLQRFVAETLEAGVAKAREYAEANSESAPRVVVVYDARITLESGKTDALIIEARELSPQAQSLKMAVPYRLASHPSGFAVYRPKFLAFEGKEPDFSEIAEAFFAGVDRHEKGAAIWNANLDESR